VIRGVVQQAACDFAFAHAGINSAELYGQVSRATESNDRSGRRLTTSLTSLSERRDLADSNPERQRIQIDARDPNKTRDAELAAAAEHLNLAELLDFKNGAVPLCLATPELKVSRGL